MPAERVIAVSGLPAHRVRPAVAEAERRGRPRRNAAELVTGSTGLTVEPTRHRLAIAGRSWWTWCAFDAAGILAALGRGGDIVSRSPLGDAPVPMTFRAGRHPPGSRSLSPSRPPGRSIVDDWCAKNQLFPSIRNARWWAES